MASLRDIRKRIRSVQGSQKITRAMKLVAASKLRRAQDAITQARPYAAEMGNLLTRVASRARAESVQDEAPMHPLLELRDAKRVMLVVITSDRGSCGAFNSNVLRRAERFLSENQERFDFVEVATVGRRARDYFARAKRATTRHYSDVFSDLHFRRASDIASELISEFAQSHLDAVFVVYNQFVTAMTQQVVLEDILPVVPTAPDETDPFAGGMDYIYAPTREDVLTQLVPRYVAMQIWRALLESAAAEHGARMTAMDAATKNAQELAEDLTLQYNRARQAAITRDLIDIVGGAEATSQS